MMWLRRVVKSVSSVRLPSPADAAEHAREEARKARAAHDAAMPVAYPLVAAQACKEVNRGSRLLEVGGMYGLIQWAVRDTMPRWHDGTAEQAENARQGFQQMKALHDLDDDLVQEQLVTDLRAAGWARTRVVFKRNLGGYPYPFIEVAS